MKSLLYLTLLATGCLAVPGDDTQPMCTQDSDCDTAHGETCDIGVCWGDPPEALYAARIGPPNGRNDLVATEITKVNINPDGWFGTNLRLEEPVHIAGTVNLACGEAPCPPIATTITVTRPSRIPGGPPFVAVTHTSEDAGDFTVEVPRANSDEQYSVVVTPDRTSAVGVNLDDVTPKRIMLSPVEDVPDLAITLGAGSNVITGTVNGVPAVHAVVRGRWEPNGPLTEVSSIATTSAADGTFAITVADGIEPDIELVLTPPTATGDLLPTLHFALSLDGGAITPITLMFPSFGNTGYITIPVEGTSTDGTVEPVANADVTLIAEEPRGAVPYSYTARLELQHATNNRGEVTFPWIQSANMTYELRVQPPPQSGPAQYATIYGQTLDLSGVTAQNQTLDPIHLASQVAVHGALYDHSGRAAEGVVVSVVPNAAYAATLSETLQSRLAEAVPTSETTHANGEFAVYVDPSIAGAPAIYDINFQPAAASLLPSWQTESVMVDPLTGYDVGDLDLPEAAYVRSVVSDPQDLALEGAEVRLYEIPPAIVTCNNLDSPADPTCAQKAILRAQATSGEGGSVHLVLPDP